MLIESKSNLAKLMATENIIVEQKAVSTAHFNLGTRTLVIPTLKSELSSFLYDLFIGHEVGHALNTPSDGWHDSITELGVNRSILNVCEDVRIEKLIRRKYPGLKMSFIKAYRELLDQDFFGVQGKDLNVLKFIDRINLHTKCGGSLGIKFDISELPLLRLAEDAETFEDTVIAAKKIQAFMLEEMEKRKEQVKQGKGDTPEDEGEEGPSEDFMDEESEQYDTDEVDAPKGNASSNNQDIDSDTDNKFREKEQELYANDSSQRDLEYANIPNLDSDSIIVDYKHIYKEIRDISNKLIPRELYDYNKHAIIDIALFAKFRKEASKVVGYLAKEFELRKNAEQLKKASTAKTGDLNMNRIYSYQFAEDVFKKISIVPNGKSHGLILFLDWSGSMHNYMHDTIKQLLTLVLFCKKVSIPFEVYAFSDQYRNTDYFDDELPLRYKDGDLLLSKVTLLNIMSSRMSGADMSFAGAALLSKIYDTGYYDQYRLGGTPLNETIVAAMDLIPKFQKKYKLQVVNTTFLTDGEGQSLTKVFDSVRGYKRVYNIVLRDPKTSAYMKYKTSGADTSKAFLFLLKQRTGCNTIGFRILNVRNAKDYLFNSYGLGANIEPIINDFRKNKSTIIKSAGFDEYYLLRADKMTTDEDDELEIKSTTTRGLVSAFKNYTKGHIQNRVVLNRFIGLIS